MMNPKNLTIVLTGGGTAGHVSPNLALLPYLKQKFHTIYYIGSTKQNEQEMVESEGVKFYPLECVKLRRGISIKNLGKNFAIPFGYCKSVKQAKQILCEIKPNIVFSKGGFVALPVVRAAKKLGIPVVIHESDTTMGLANKLSVGSASLVCTSFQSEKYINTGSPIRQKIYNGDGGVILERHGLGNEKRKLLVVGGSLGAARINEVVRNTIGKLRELYDVIHICGRGKINEDINLKFKNYVQIEYCGDIENYFAWADIVVSRAGSNTLCELMVLGKPTLFIPLATGRGDQIDNVKEIIKRNAAEVLYEQNLNPDSFVRAVNSVFENRALYNLNAKGVTKDGTEIIANTIYGVVCNK